MEIFKQPSFLENKCEESNCNEPCAGGCPLYWLKFNSDKEIKGIDPKNKNARSNI